jgi:cell division protein FtsI (penicillin-binding protein 3)
MSGREYSSTRAGVRGVNFATSPLLAAPTPPRRSVLVVALFGLAFAAMAGRAAWVQLIHTDFYLKEGDKRFLHSIELPASRGRILDRNGTLLATSLPVSSVWTIPRDFQADAAQRRRLAGLLGITPAQLDERVGGPPQRFTWLQRGIDDASWARIAELDIDGVGRQREYRRQYPEGETAAQLVGFTDIDDRGQEGVELTFDDRLLGRTGTRSVVKDRLGRVVDVIGSRTDPVAGADVTLSIDSRLQYQAYRQLQAALVAHKASAGSVVVLDVRTGELLALANAPSFDPARRGGWSAQQLRNRALTDVFEPGSTIKPFIAAWAIESGRVTPETPVQTAPGRTQVSGITITDAHPHGLLTVAEVIQKSSNVGIVKLAMQMRPREMWELFSSVGFGQKPQIDSPGAVSGRLRPYKSWRPIEQATMAYGYGLSTSLLQIARAYTVFARDGQIIPVTLLRREAPVDGPQVLSVDTARAVRDMLHRVTGPGGTAPRAQTVGYSVGGKTGTAHKQEGRGYAGHHYRAWFVGLAPISDPRLVVAVMIDDPTAGEYFGGDVAAPVFSRVMQESLRILGVPNDIPVRTQIATTAAEPESF